MVGIHWNKDMLQKLDKIKALSKTSGKILDVGAGDGETFELFDEGWEWSGIDIEPMDDKVIEGDAHQIDFPDKHFDLVISIAAFEHIHSPWIAIKEINRVMKKGAHLFGTVAFLEREHGNSHFHMSQHGIRKILEIGNFRDIKIEPMPGWNVMTSMNILPYMGFYNRFKSAIIFGIRRSLIRFIAAIRTGSSKLRAQEFLENDIKRYSGSFLFICKK